MENLSRELTKSSNKMIAGVCAGIAEYVGWDVTIVRVVYLLLSIFTAAFPGLILYLVLCIVMPQPKTKLINLNVMENLNRKLIKSNDKMIAGVCAGIAEYFGWDVTIVRVMYVLLSLFTVGFPGLILYLILCIVMPQPEA